MALARIVFVWVPTVVLVILAVMVQLPGVVIFPAGIIPPVRVIELAV